MKKTAVFVALVLITWMVPSTLMAGIRCYTYKRTYPGGDVRCGVRCEDRTSYAMDCGADIFAGGYDQEYGLIIDGSHGPDSLFGSGSDEFIAAFAGDDSVVGLAGDDWLEGGDGDDVLAGGAGDDLLFGDDGDDQYLYEAGDGNDVIMDSLGNNRLTLTADLATSLTPAPSGDDLVLYVDAPGIEGSITILGYYSGATFSIEVSGPPPMTP